MQGKSVITTVFFDIYTDGANDENVKVGIGVYIPPMQINIVSIQQR